LTKGIRRVYRGKVWAIIALVFAAFALSCCVYLWLELQRRVCTSDLTPLLQSSSDELSKAYEKRLKAIEVEWEDMYQKFSRLTGRMDRQKALANPSETPEVPAPQPLTRSDLLRRFRNK
jgi:hypothetical protein